MTSDFLLSPFKETTTSFSLYVLIMLWRIPNLVTAHFSLPYDVIYVSFSPIHPLSAYKHTKPPRSLEGRGHYCFRAQEAAVQMKIYPLSLQPAPQQPFLIRPQLKPWCSCPLNLLRKNLGKTQKLSEKTQITLPPPQSTSWNRWTVKFTIGFINYFT